MIRGYRKLPADSKELTQRQHEVAMLLMRGYSYQQIADQLVISRRTTQDHIGAIYKKFGVESHTQAMAIANAHMPFCVPDGLTKRQIEIVQLLATGKQNKEIAGALVISDKTVLAHTRDIYAKLGVASRAEAVARCVGG